MGLAWAKNQRDGVPVSSRRHKLRSPESMEVLHSGAAEAGPNCPAATDGSGQKSICRDGTPFNHISKGNQTSLPQASDCKVHLADPSMEKNWRGTTRGDRDRLPRWFSYFRKRMRLKETVTTTAGNDGYDQVVLIAPQDHERMIRLYFAMRVWVLQDYIVPK